MSYLPRVCETCGLNTTAGKDGRYNRRECGQCRTWRWRHNGQPRPIEVARAMVRKQIEAELIRQHGG